MYSWLWLLALLWLLNLSVALDNFKVENPLAPLDSLPPCPPQIIVSSIQSFNESTCITKYCYRFTFPFGDTTLVQPYSLSLKEIHLTQFSDFLPMPQTPWNVVSNHELSLNFMPFQTASNSLSCMEVKGDYLPTFHPLILKYTHPQQNCFVLVRAFSKRYEGWVLMGLSILVGGFIFFFGNFIF